MPPRGDTGFMCGVGQVSWLEAARLAFPGLISPVAFSSGRYRVRSGFSQWRGRAGFSPASGMTHPPYRIVQTVSIRPGSVSTPHPKNA